MRNLTISSKFRLVMGVFGTIAILATVYSGHQLSNMNDAYRQLLDRDAATVEALSAARTSLQTARAALGDLLMSQTDSLKATASNELKKAKQEFIAHLDAASAKLADPAEAQELKRDGVGIIEKSCASAVMAAQVSTAADEIQASQQVALFTCRPGFEVLTAKLTEMVERITIKVNATSEILTETSTRAIGLTIGGVVTLLLLVLLAGSWFANIAIVKPMKNLSSTMSTLAEGDFDATVPEAERTDEIGVMGRAVQVFKENGLKARRMEEEARLVQVSSDEERYRNAALEKSRLDEVTTVTRSLAEGLARLAKGDVSFELRAQFPASYEALRGDFNSAVSQLRAALLQVATASQSIDTGSQEIRHSVGDLSRRTEQQAATLEETAAALNQISQNVSVAADRAKQARDLAKEANSAAHRSGQVMADAVRAMQEIEQSSNEVAGIVGVIDEIAFQTNLLALNAGVEAARAGEAGKGFAVVAQEVRELAQRSARSAREIKTLIRNSAEEVLTGVRLVSDTGRALKVIEQHVSLINTELEAISSSTIEQSTGLAEVNSSVSQMDQVTQQNAAMVEEATAAVSVLAEEVEQLSRLVAGFELGTLGRRVCSATDNALVAIAS
ncbi:methyl-accepting chemotaxis protein [Rhizobium leguminosarum]|uniref:Methyl-accepting chemotaxis protein n=2 Tax=Rhizobium leguminosarum TaxID=384 RepID=J0GXU9_RHILT|nr:methyl-accepting chemotaxis protein [Rhizobium leguminosarum]EJB02373.1 methyl-accepting chemotaxis protein [Rhizobium leguminosarum bv. trifolii WSM597]EJB08363.1 methyl-accepting chemotaxis protein [Rhizobium leguminosarum bv. trifolii WSM597]NYJ11018.1 methyl-accepting chemotaxis protein [Rhizobium leguminosarum]